MSQSAPYLYQEELYQIAGSIVIVLPKPWQSVTEDEKQLLSKILGSVRVNIGSVTIVHSQSGKPEDYASFSPQKVLIFGAAIHPDLSPYQNTVVNGTSIIRADDLATLDDAKKKSLWQALRQMFGV